jgi:tRNA(Ile)-lysidine synthase
MHLVRPWVSAQAATLRVATVDHGLRTGSGAEARQVAHAARHLGLPHHTLKWTGWNGQGNLQDAARQARRDLLAAWARAHDLSAVVLGHTQDDQAETFLLRLARGSGVDGLAAMAEASEADGVVWLRPLLGLGRADLRDWLSGQGMTWSDDPSNVDTRFDRVRVRNAAPVLAELGLDPARLAGTAASMARARAALLARAHDCALRLARVEHGLVQFDLPGLGEIEAETRLRLLAHGLTWTATQTYRPRLASLEACWAQILAGQTATLHGCLLIPSRGRLFVSREYAAVETACVPGGQLWDERWGMGIPDRDLRIAALGARGVQALGVRPLGIPYAALPSLPALWDGDTVVAVPALNWGLSAQVYKFPDTASFLQGLIPH